MKRHEQAILLLEKARQDETLVDEVVTSEKVSDEIVGFHCQQAAEKLLKALLAYHGVHFHRTHNLRQLMVTLADEGHALPEDLQDIDTLSPFAAVLRYEAPPMEVSLDRTHARDQLRRLREWVESQIDGSREVYSP